VLDKHGDPVLDETGAPVRAPFDGGSRPAVLEQAILEYLRPRRASPPTFHRISIDLVGLPGDRSLRSPLETALWHLVDKKHIEHTVETPVRFRDLPMVVLLDGTLQSLVALVDAVAAARFDATVAPTPEARKNPLTLSYVQALAEAFDLAFALDGAERAKAEGALVVSGLDHQKMTNAAAWKRASAARVRPHPMYVLGAATPALPALRKLAKTPPAGFEGALASAFVLAERFDPAFALFDEGESWRP
jgi:hypothetical protein